MKAVLYRLRDRLFGPGRPAVASRPCPQASGRFEAEDRHPRSEIQCWGLYGHW